MHSIGESFGSLWVFFRVKWFSLKEAWEVRRRFPTFSTYDKAFKKAYRFRNPYKICKTHLIQKGEKEVDVYGETPLPVYARIAEECTLNRDDLLIELGCGRGRGAFFLSHLAGCRVVGIDWVPFFIGTADAISKSATPHLPVDFRCEEMLAADMSQASAVYLYGTCLPDDQIEALVCCFEKLPPATKIITVSYPLCEYSLKFRTLKQFTAAFPWGEGEVFLNAQSAIS
ncbi:MAG: class I SAM-dependent methyltransferase [Verrucomicrobia bacterium]|nr:class I SAM-dependent methyltransferase [Verrucomicrobiota bacterium]